MIAYVPRLAAATLSLVPAASFAQSGPMASSVSYPRAPSTPIATSYPAAAAGNGANTAGYNLSRWAEDWRMMRDPAKRDDPLDRLKYLPLDKKGEIYLTLSGELRLRLNNTSSPNLRAGPDQRQDQTRIVGGADLHVGPHFRAFGELVHGGLGGTNLGTPSGNFRNDLAVQQAFVEADTVAGNIALGARYGRQEFTDGPNLMVSQRDNNVVRYTLNGIRAWARGSKLRVDLFDLKPTMFGNAGTGDDHADGARRFSGATFGIVLPKSVLGRSNLYLDPFFWRRRNDAGAWGGRTGPTVRYYAGARLWGDVGRISIDWSASHQFGHYIDQSIDAWQIAAATTYRLGRSSSAPRIGFHADYATGGGGYGGAKLRNAYAPFGNNVYYSYQLFLTPSNLITLAPSVTVSPIEPIRVTAEYELAWRDNVHDAVYRANGQPFAGTQKVGGKRIGDVARLQMVWTITPRLSLTGRYEHLAAGPVLTRAGFHSSDFLSGWVSFRF
jgi:hypothetical protein